MSRLLSLILLTLASNSLTGQTADKPVSKPSKEESVTTEVEMEETLITPLNSPEEDMYRLPEDASPSLVEKKKKLVEEASKLTQYSEQVSDFIDNQNEATASDKEKEKLNKLLENYTKQLNTVEKAEDDFLTELIEYNKVKDGSLPKGEAITEEEVKKMRMEESKLPTKEDKPEALLSH